MDRIDRLLQRANRIAAPAGVHCIRAGYCTQCGGPCTAYDSEGVVMIFDDIPKDYVFIQPDLTVYATAVPAETAGTAEEDTPEREEDTPYSRLFGHG